MKVLAIDTSTYALGVAIVDGSNVLGEFITNMKTNHSVRLMPAIHHLCKEVNIKPKELDRIVVAKGPGSYTGVRIGVTTAKAMAWSLHIPIVGVSSLEVLAQNGSFFHGDVSPLFDARRGQVYTGLYGKSENGFSVKLEDQNILLQDWLHQVKERDTDILFLGNDVVLHQELIREVLEDKAIIAPPSFNNPRPSELAFLGMEREPDELHSFVPNYIRLAEAEAKWLAATKK